MLDAYRIRSVEVSDTEVILTLAGGRVLREPIRNYVRLNDASPDQRQRWQLVDDAYGVAWPELAPVVTRGMIHVLDQLWDAVYERVLGRLANAGWELGALSAEDQLLVALWRLEADINNGGFMQFLCNWGDETCQLAIRALDELGADATCALVRRMRGILDRLEDDPSITELTDLYGAMTEGEHAEMETLDKAFWAYPNDLARLGLNRFGT